MRARRLWYGSAGLLAAAFCGLLACSGNADRGRPTDSADAAFARSPDGPAPLASDASLTIQAAPAVIEALRAVADSFSSREAIRVEFTSDPGMTEGTSLVVASGADVVVVAGNLVPQLLVDSASWMLPFATWPAPRAETAAATDSARDGANAGATRRKPLGRPSSGRRADSVRADSARRDSVQQVRMRSDRARADSARVLVLTIPERAPNTGVAERFVRYLLTDGRGSLRGAGLELLPRLVITGDPGRSGVRAVVDTVMARSGGVEGDSVPQR
ncbi:MAG TPA: hypothetical protein VE869_17895 [Gemmatimonas sp.]|nr:hypothetical protein [Gemmatimonas sp.]